MFIDPKLDRTPFLLVLFVSKVSVFAIAYISRIWKTLTFQSNMTFPKKTDNIGNFHKANGTTMDFDGFHSRHAYESSSRYMLAREDRYRSWKRHKENQDSPWTRYLYLLRLQNRVKNGLE